MQVFSGLYVNYIVMVSQLGWFRSKSFPAGMSKLAKLLALLAAHRGTIVYQGTTILSKVGAGNIFTTL